MSAVFFTSYTGGTVQLPGSVRLSMLATVQILAADRLGEGRGRAALPTAADLNACLQYGGDGPRLVARLSAQVELICWVDGPNRAWLAGLVQEASGRGEAVPLAPLDAADGWPEVVDFLRADESEPVFIGCSYGRPFPNSEGWEGEPEAWHELSHADQWAHSEGVLRGESAREDATAYLAEHPTLFAAPFSRELRPANWCQYFFAEPENVLC